MKSYFFLTIFALAAISTFAQEEQNPIDTVYRFKNVVDLKATPVKDQYKSGTCWAFSGISFIESELIRMGKGEFDLSEMFIVNRDYHVRAIDYVRWNGAKSFSAGAEGCNVFSRIREWGIVPQEAYEGLNYGTTKHVNSELDDVLKSYVSTIIRNPNGKLSTAWLKGFDGILDAYLGEIPSSFEYNGKEYTPISFRDYLGINLNDYIEITSLSHHPLYSRFIIEVPDNWELGQVYNVTMEEMAEIAFNSLDKGYTVLWGGDVSENGFSWAKGLAIVPDDNVVDMKGTDRARFKQAGTTDNNEANEQKPAIEKTITAEMRQEAFDNFETTDDHGMHLTGYATDVNGTRYFKVKNSWDSSNIYNGYLYMSENFFKYKTLTIIVHKNAIPSGIKKKLNL